MSEVTFILNRFEGDDPSAAEDLLPLVYQELRVLAQQRLAHERPGQTLQATALVHEAYLRVIRNGEQGTWQSRAQFFAAAAEAMRRILIENARRKSRIKHGGGRVRVDVDRADIAFHLDPDYLLRFDEAIEQLSEIDQTAAQLVKLRYFSGLSIEDGATTLGIGLSTAYRHWTFARAFLHSQLGESKT